MAILKREFHHHERGNHDEKWYYLARDTDTGDVFIIHEWAERANLGERRVSLGEFLARIDESGKRRLVELIGTLVE